MYGMYTSIDRYKAVLYDRIMYMEIICHRLQSGFKIYRPLIIERNNMSTSLWRALFRVPSNSWVEIPAEKNLRVAKDPLAAFNRDNPSPNLVSIRHSDLVQDGHLRDISIKCGDIFR